MWMRGNWKAGLVALTLCGVPLAAWAQSGPEAAPEATPEEPTPAVAQEPAAPAAEARGGVSASGRDGADINYELRLRELEDRLNELKEDIFRSKSRLFLLREQILQSEIGGSRAVLTHVNSLSATYRIMQVSYVLDGEPVFSATMDTTDLNGDIEVYSGAILPGPHNLAVEFVLQGNDYGVFTYMDGYEIPVRSSFQFEVEEGQTVELDIAIEETGGPNRPLEERPDVRFELQSTDTTADNADAGE
jgi:hypothetical protein